MAGMGASIDGLREKTLALRGSFDPGDERVERGIEDRF